MFHWNCNWNLKSILLPLLEQCEQRTKAIVPPLADPEIIATRAIAIVFILGMSECHRVCTVVGHAENSIEALACGYLVSVELASPGSLEGDCTE